MRKNVFGRKLKRDTNERKALFKNLMSSLILHERIETTEAKAKAIRPMVEKLVTKAKNKGKESKDQLRKYIGASALDKFVLEVAPRFAKRNGGYTRIIKTGFRIKDKASMAIIEWVEKAQQEGKKETEGTKGTKKLKRLSSKTEVVDAEIVKEKPKKEKKKGKKAK